MLHLVQGSDAAHDLRGSLGLEDVVASRDPLSVGPVPVSEEESLTSWLRRRMDFWKTLPGVREDGAQEAAAKLQRCREATAVTLWLGLDPAEQLLGAWFCAQAMRRAVPPKVHLIQFVSSRTPSGRVLRAWNLNLVSEDGLMNHPPATELTREGIVRFARLWDAWVSPEPWQLVEIGKGNDDVHSAVAACLLDYYPDRVSGLGRWDLALLRNIHAHGPRLVRAIAHTLEKSHDDGDLVGDIWLFARVRRLGARSLRCPLVELSSDSEHMRDVDVRLTEHGRDVLESRANAVDLNGIDERIGGVHLDSSVGRVRYRIPGGLTEE